MIFKYFLKNKKKTGIVIMITAMLLAILPFIAPTSFKVKIEYGVLYDIYFYSSVKIVSWLVAVTMFFFFGFAIFLQKEGENNNDV